MRPFQNTDICVNLDRHVGKQAAMCAEEIHRKTQVFAPELTLHMGFVCSLLCYFKEVMIAVPVMWSLSRPISDCDNGYTLLIISAMIRAESAIPRLRESLLVVVAVLDAELLRESMSVEHSKGAVSPNQCAGCVCTKCYNMLNK